jgi:small-conductance mechanosensitive channel
MLANNLVVVPNAKLAQAIVVNHHLPSSDLAVLVEVGVDYASDLRQVERVVMEVGRDVMAEVPGGGRDLEPFIRYHTFADSSVNFTVILRAKEFVDQYLITHEFVNGCTRGSTMTASSFRSRFGRSHIGAIRQRRKAPQTAPPTIVAR